MKRIRQRRPLQPRRSRPEPHVSPRKSGAWPGDGRTDIAAVLLGAFPGCLPNRPPAPGTTSQPTKAATTPQPQPAQPGAYPAFPDAGRAPDQHRRPVYHGQQGTSSASLQGRDGHRSRPPIRLPAPRPQSLAATGPAGQEELRSPGEPSSECSAAVPQRPWSPEERGSKSR
jgi:hypothetical protein